MNELEMRARESVLCLQSLADNAAGLGLSLEEVIALDAAITTLSQQAAGVPERREWNQAGGRESMLYTDGWNDCREAMLAAAPKPEKEP